MTYRWERREKKQISKKSRMKKHGKNISQQYENTVLKKILEQRNDNS